MFLSRIILCYCGKCHFSILPLEYIFIMSHWEENYIDIYYFKSWTDTSTLRSQWLFNQYSQAFVWNLELHYWEEWENPICHIWHVCICRADVTAFQLNYKDLYDWLQRLPRTDSMSHIPHQTWPQYSLTGRLRMEWENSYCSNCKNSRRLKMYPLLKLALTDGNRKGEKRRKQANQDFRRERGRGTEGKSGSRTKGAIFSLSHNSNTRM